MDLLADFDFFDPAPSTSTTDRERRIDAARKASAQYSAKIEPAGWFNSPSLTPQHHPDSVRNDLFCLHQLYFQSRYGEVIERGIAMIESGKGKKVAKGKTEGMLSGEVEVLDLVLRSTLRAGSEVGPQEVALAKRYRLHKASSSGLSYTSSLILSRAPPTLAPPLESLQAILAAIGQRPAMYPYLEQLERILTAHFPQLLPDSDGLKGEGEREAEMERIGLGEDERKILGKALVRGGVEDGAEEDEPRNVRSL